MQGDVDGSLAEFDRALQLDSSIRPCKQILSLESSTLHSGTLSIHLLSSYAQTSEIVLSTTQMEQQPFYPEIVHLEKTATISSVPEILQKRPLSGADMWQRGLSLYYLKQ